MCLSTAYKLIPGEEDEKICEFISEVKVDGDRIVLTDIMGKEIEVPGTIKAMDFVGSKLYIGA
jgi:predicted RNA-binding protein